MKQANEAKLNELFKKQEDFDAILKSHRRELEVSHQLVCHHHKKMHKVKTNY